MTTMFERPATKLDVATQAIKQVGAIGVALATPRGRLARPSMFAVNDATDLANALLAHAHWLAADTSVIAEAVPYLIGVDGAKLADAVADHVGGESDGDEATGTEDDQGSTPAGVGAFGERPAGSPQ